MAVTKKPRKPYRPKPSRTPSLLFKVAPQVTEEKHREVDLFSLIHLDNIRRGQGQEEDVFISNSTVKACYVLAAAFENKSDLQTLCRLASTALYTINKKLATGQKDIEPYLLETPQLVTELYGEMARACSRDVLVRALRAYADRDVKMLNIKTGEAIVMEPEFKSADPTNFLVDREPACTYINRRVRRGYVVVNRNLERYEFYVPDEDITVPITTKTLLLLDRPLSQKKLRPLKTCWES